MSEPRDIAAETTQITADLIDCNRQDFWQVKRLLDRIQDLANIHIKADTIRYLYEDDIFGEKQLEDPFNDTVTDTGLQILQRNCTPWLVKILSKPPAIPADATPAVVFPSGDNDGDDGGATAGPISEEDFVDMVSNIMSMLCGRTATGECTTTWHLQATGSFTVMETTFTEAEIGFQTWGGGVMLAKMIDQKVIDVTNQNVLELGCGTGLAGLVAARAGCKLAVLTDYHPTVLNNAQFNVERNNVTSTAHVAKLDWLWSLPIEERLKNAGAHGGDHLSPEEQIAYAALDEESQDPILLNTDFQLVIAADCIFDILHSRMVPKVAKRYLSRHPDARFHVVLPHREKFRRELAEFEKNMPAEGWILESREWIEKSTINFCYYIFKLEQ
eukprot:jgi/Hompol1/6598/HPOL_001395-RA